MDDSNEATLKSKNYFGSQLDEGNSTLIHEPVTGKPKNTRRKKSLPQEIKQVLKVNRLQPSRLFQGLGESDVNNGRSSVKNKPQQGKLGKGYVLSSYKSQIDISKQNQ